jgi:hypothetical protein
LIKPSRPSSFFPLLAILGRLSKPVSRAQLPSPLSGLADEWGPSTLIATPGLRGSVFLLRLVFDSDIARAKLPAPSLISRDSFVRITPSPL